MFYRRENKKNVKIYKKNEDFMFTYGDGVSNVNINQLIKFRKEKLITVTAVRPPARFVKLLLKQQVKSFKEKPQVTEGWINGGFFIQPKFLQIHKGW